MYGQYPLPLGICLPGLRYSLVLVGDLIETLQVLTLALLYSREIIISDTLISIFRGVNRVTQS